MHGDLTSAASVSTDGNDDVVTVEFVVKVVKKLCLFLLVYSLGYLGFHFLVATILLIFIFDYIRTETKKERLQVARELALGHEEEIILEILPKLPAWIKFSEREKVEWLNKIFTLLWEQVNGYTQELLPKILEPAVQKYVSGFRFEQINVGHVPLRINGIKVCDTQDVRKIAMDLDVSYDGDCYVTFQTYKFTGGIKDIKLNGRLRVVLTPLVARMPLIGGLQAYFMESPKIDFDLIKVTQILDLPGVGNRIKTIIKNIIDSMYLYPNAFSINLTKGVNMSKIAVFRTEGILRVHVVEAKNLINKDLIGKSDPYVVLQVGSIRLETPVIENTLNPKWDFWCEFEIVPNSEMKIEVWDKDDAPSDDFLGRARVDISQVVKVGQMDMPISLQDVDRGTIYLRLTWLSLSSQYSDLDFAIKEIQLLSPDLHTALLMIYLDSSLNLPLLSKTEPNPFVNLQVEDETKRTDAEQQTCGPNWDKGFTFLLRNPKEAVLSIRVYDEDNMQLLGELSYEVDKLGRAPDMAIQRQTFFFNKPYSEASICCSMKLRILKNMYVEEKNEDAPRKVLVKQGSSVSSKNNFVTESESAFSENETNLFLEDEIISTLGQIKVSLGYISQRQRLLIKIHEVNILQKYSQNLDPYVKAILQTDKDKSVKKKTKILKETTNPCFNEDFDYLIAKHDLRASILTLIVKSKTFFGKKFLGQTIIELTKCDQLTVPYTNWFNLKPKGDMHYVSFG